MKLHGFFYFVWIYGFLELNWPVVDESIDESIDCKEKINNVPFDLSKMTKRSVRNALQKKKDQ